MKRATILLALVALVPAIANAQLREVKQSIFGMD
jgi:hypothetical protein